MSFRAIDDITPPTARPINAATSILVGPGQYVRATSDATSANVSGSTNTHKAATAKRHPMKTSSPGAIGCLADEHCEHPAGQSDISGEFT